jgi:hypothetical protein
MPKAKSKSFRYLHPRDIEYICSQGLIVIYLRYFTAFYRKMPKAKCKSYMYLHPRDIEQMLRELPVFVGGRVSFSCLFEVPIVYMIRPAGVKRYE